MQVQGFVSFKATRISCYRVSESKGNTYSFYEKIIFFQWTCILLKNIGEQYGNLHNLLNYNFIGLENSIKFCESVTIAVFFS